MIITYYTKLRVYDEWNMNNFDYRSLLKRVNQKQQEALINKTASKQEKQIDEEKKEIEERNLPIDKLYKKIAMVVHPDRNMSDSETEQGRKKKIFLNTKAAHDRGDWAKLFLIATDLEIQVSDSVEEQIRLFEESIEVINHEIEKTHKTASWMWYHMGSEKEKEEFMLKYFAFLLQ